MFALLYGAICLTSGLIGERIPYDLPGTSNTIRAQSPLAVVGLLISILGFVVITVAGEETMFRGLAQTRIGKRYGIWAGILVAAVLFGLRHLPNDIYYAHIWKATPRMWLSIESQLSLTAVILGITRYFGRSTYASSVTHGLLLVTALLGL
jgi:membrane protease YdiL (CAAX protease family)